MEVKALSLDTSSRRPEANGLQTCLVGTTGVGCHWSQVGRGQGCCKSPPNKNDLAPNVHRAQAENSESRAGCSWRGGGRLLGGGGWPRLCGVLNEDSKPGTLNRAVWGKSKGSKHRRGSAEKQGT